MFRSGGSAVETLFGGMFGPQQEINKGNKKEGG